MCYTRKRRAIIVCNMKWRIAWWMLLWIINSVKLSPWNWLTGNRWIYLLYEPMMMDRFRKNAFARTFWNILKVSWSVFYHIISTKGVMNWTWIMWIGIRLVKFTIQLIHTYIHTYIQYTLIWRVNLNKKKTIFCSRLQEAEVINLWSCKQICHKTYRSFMQGWMIKLLIIFRASVRKLYLNPSLIFNEVLNSDARES